MTHEDDKTVLYRQGDGSWVTEIPAIPGCYALIGCERRLCPSWQGLIAEEYRSKGQSLPEDTTEIINA